MCNIFRTNASSPTAPSGVISEGIAPVAEAAALSEATTLALTSMRDFGEVRETGPISTIAQSWQVLPPNSGATYELRESRNSSEPVAGSVEGDWKFWVDQATGLPIKASVTGENIEPEVSYYTYASSLLEAGNLPPDFFLMEGSQSPSCVAGGTLGGWTFNEDAFVAQDARAPAVVYGAAGPITLRPVGAAADGLMSRAELQASGIELSSRGSDEQNLHWTIEGEESYSFKEDGSNIIIEGESGEPAAVLSERTANTSVVNASAVEEESGAADELVLHPDQTPARVSVQAVESGRRFSPCITKEDQERAAAVHQEVLEEEAQMPSYGPEASSSISTTQIKIWINPHPGLAGTAVTDKYEVCNSPHTKLFGSDGYVVFGGCPVGRSVTFTVPEQVEANGVTYRVPDASRTLSPPASGWVITFGYSEVSSSGGWTPNPGGEIENEMIEVGGNEAEASSTPHNANPATACTMWVSIPYRTHTAIGYTAEAWLAVRCTKSHFVENWEAHHYLYSEPQMLNPEPREERAHRHYWEVPVWEAGSYQSALEQKFISTACNALNISKWWNSAKRFISYGEIPGEGPYVTKPSFKTVHKKISCG